MPNEWAGVVSTTAPQYLKGAIDLTVRDRLWMAMLKKNGRISYNEYGSELRWQVEMAQQAVQQYGDGGTVNFAPVDRFRQLVADWRASIATDAMTEKQKLMNKGNAMLIDRYKTILPALQKSILNQFGLEVYVDGTQPGNENRLSGIESFMATTGTTAAGDRIAQNGSTYGGRSCVLGNQGGSWSTNLPTPNNAQLATDWPDGIGSGPEYDYMAAKLVNWSSTAWGTGGTSWEDNCEKAIRQALLWCRILGGKSGAPDLVMMDPTLFYGFKNRESSKQRIWVPYKEAEDLGFSDTLNFEGAGIYCEYGCPSQTAYCLNFDEMDLHCLWSQLFMSKGPYEDIRTLSWLFLVGFWGNLTFNPKAFAKLKNYA